MKSVLRRSVRTAVEKKKMQLQFQVISQMQLRMYMIGNWYWEQMNSQIQLQNRKGGNMCSQMRLLLRRLG